jgi:hypothetical protein
MSRKSLFLSYSLRVAMLAAVGFVAVFLVTWYWLR